MFRSSGARDGCTTQADTDTTAPLHKSSQLSAHPAPIQNQNPVFKSPPPQSILILDPSPPQDSIATPSQQRLHPNRLHQPITIHLSPTTEAVTPPPSLPLSPLPKWTFPTVPPSTSRSCFVASVQWSSGMIRASGSILSRYPVHGCFHCARSGVRIPVEPFFLSAPRRTLEV